MPTIKSKKLTEIHLEQIKFNDGAEVHYVLFKNPESVAILPILNEKKIILVKQYRYAIKDYSWEIPAGGIHENETNINAAKRELREETGYKSEAIEHFNSFYPSNAMSNEKVHVYKATCLTKKKIRLTKELLEKDIEVKSFSLSNLFTMINKGEITDAATIIAIQLLINNV
jgi:ADP-ribose pyrophosphatase